MENSKLKKCYLTGEMLSDSQIEYDHLVSQDYLKNLFFNCLKKYGGIRLKWIDFSTKGKKEFENIIEGNFGELSRRISEEDYEELRKNLKNLFGNVNSNEELYENYVNLLRRFKEEVLDKDNLFPINKNLNKSKNNMTFEEAFRRRNSSDSNSSAFINELRKRPIKWAYLIFQEWNIKKKKRKDIREFIKNYFKINLSIEQIRDAEREIRDKKNGIIPIILISLISIVAILLLVMLFFLISLFIKRINNGKNKEMNTMVYVDSTYNSTNEISQKIFLNCENTKQQDDSTVIIYFDYNKYNLPDFTAECLKNSFKDIKTKTFVLEGYTCDLGTDLYNDSLSSARSNYIKNLLLAVGVESSHIKVINYGEKHFQMFNNNIEISRKLNRRVILKIK